MEMDDDVDSEPPAPGTEEDGSGRPPFPPGIASVRVWESSSYFSELILYVYIQNKRRHLRLTFIIFCLAQIGESSALFGRGQKRKASQLNKARTIGSNPIIYTQPAFSAGKNSSQHNVCC